MAGNGVILYDANGYPVSCAANTALAAPQAALVHAGSDYGTAPKAQVVKVDARGSQYAIPSTPAGGSALYAGNQASGALASQYGSLMMGRQDDPAPSTMLPLTLDMSGALNVHLKSKQTFRALAAGITCSTNKSLMSVANSGTMVLRLQTASVYVPSSGSGGTLLGASATTYYPLICEMRRVASATGGTAITPVGSDTQDVLAPGIVCATGATVGVNLGTFHRQDAAQTAGNGANQWFSRGEANEKSFVLRPGEAVHIVCLSNGLINDPTGKTTVAAVVDVQLVFTQAPA